MVRLVPPEALLPRFEEFCRRSGGEVEVTEDGYTCTIRNPSPGTLMDVIASAIESGKPSTALFTTGGVELTDLAIYREPQLVTELLRIRYHDRNLVPITLMITKQGAEYYGLI